MANAVRFFEAIKTIGSLVGLATGAFVIWDRVIRYRPIVSLARPPGDLAQMAEAVLQIGNPSDSTARIDEILISRGDAVHVFFKEDSARAFLPHCPEIMTGLIEARTTAFIPLMIHPSHENAPGTTAVTIKIYWRHLRQPRLPQVPLWIFFTLSDIRAMHV